MTHTKVRYLARFDYEVMVQEALRKVVQEALVQVEKNGLPGSHHFYITFQTDRPDVTLPNFLKDKHPEEITIVLQHQFWDLKVTDYGFSVSLSFNDVHEKIAVPYTAIISFLDPSVKFGLQFIPDEPEDVVPMAENSMDISPAPKSKSKAKHQPKENNVVALDQFRKK